MTVGTAYAQNKKPNILVIWGDDIGHDNISGGGIAFMRPITKESYGIPPEQVVGSSVVSEFQVKDGKPELVRMPKIDFINDKAGKPVGIYQHIGRRPILAFGNADADMQMVEYIMAGEGSRLGLFLHHTDAEREFAYDRKSHVGTLDKALDQAAANGWIMTGIPYVIVNGQIVVKDSVAQEGVYAGKPIRAAIKN